MLILFYGKFCEFSLFIQSKPNILKLRKLLKLRHSQKKSYKTTNFVSCLQTCYTQHFPQFSSYLFIHITFSPCLLTWKIELHITVSSRSTRHGGGSTKWFSGGLTFFLICDSFDKLVKLTMLILKQYLTTRQLYKVNMKFCE